MTDPASPGPVAEPEDLTDLGAIFPGGTEMARRCRAFDWAATPLGPVAMWPSALRTAAGMVVAAGFPAILLWGPALIQIYNDGYVPFLGAKHPGGLGMPTLECWPEVRDINVPIFARVLAGETVSFRDMPLPLQRRGPDQPPEDVYITMAFSPVPGAVGDVAGIFVTLLETTADVQARALEAERVRLLAELGAERERLRTVLLQLPTPMALFEGSDLRHTLVNAAYRRISGGGRDVTGLTPAEAYPELVGSGVFELIAGVYASGEPWIGSEIPLRYDRDGTGPMDTWWDLRYVPVRDAAGAVAGVLSVAVDLTDQVLARREVERLLAESEVARAEAEAANRVKGDFLAVMSHELRTPLNAIGGYAQLLELGLHGPVTPEQAVALDRIQRGQQHLLGLINAVLNYAKLEAGHVVYCAEQVTVADAVAEVAALVAPQARAKGVALDVANATDTPAVVRADAEKVRQVLLNLLSNAVKFTAGGGTISIDWETRAAGVTGDVATGPRVLVRVADTGCGIAADQLARVFDPFVQVDQRLTRAEEGVGLGLAISRDLARGMDGDLTAKSTVGVGSTFTLSLPAA